MAHNTLEDKVALVTGGGSGIGAATARRLAGQGARVVVVDVNGDAAKQTAESLPTESLAIAADVSKEADVERYAEQALDRFGRIDLYHLNAGILGTLDRLTDLTVDDFDRVTSVNLRGPFLGLRTAFRCYESQGNGGAIVLTSSIGGLRGSADLLPYQASKHGVIGLTYGAAMFGGSRGVRVNAVAPGLVPTGLFTGVAGAGKNLEQRGTTTPLRRVGTPEEIAGVVAFLLGDDAAYITGEVVSVDGGAAMVNTVRPSGGAGAWRPEETA
ncbi:MULTISPECIES: SDR family NAD(P)-dependent oxidoreductase [Actinomadura]|uniref:Enoyl-(Acyl carrier protein) reductase n=1 Tax=Actinomadura madurae TaxID=1993 RepID=A0A1I5F392_9ACTN|nr:SDR family oxidoreductase [Actinomadura madurae]SFO18225.1 Enoyl-(Acyl carrier protein) reductase [Actinomadura madurae]SPT60200.1 Levodione reductase [Actinomadura madurae]